MVFSSVIFLFVFLPVVLVFYYLLHEKYRNIWLFFASLFFYSWGEPKNILLMIISIAANYLFSYSINFSRSKKIISNSILVVSVAFNLGMLFVFKYVDFFIKNINVLFSLEIPLKKIALPIGISFFTFQSMSYVIDVWRGTAKIQKNILNLGLYISFFPQLIAGPIVRYSDIEKQLLNRVCDVQKFYDGTLRFMIGFSKKILIADQLAQTVDTVFKQGGISAPSAWLGVIAYALQIYFDFSGYSDMAIGLGKLFGFNFNENFNYPYISKSIREFWRRWHISLSTWFRDYVYIPMGGSRCGASRAYFNLFFVFLLTGMWHGASWNFVVWGIYYAVFLIFERVWFGKVLEKMPRVLQHLYTLTVVLCGWIFFQATDIKSAVAFIGKLFTVTETMWIDFIWIIDRRIIFCLICGIIFSMPISSWIVKKLGNKLAIMYDVFVLCIFIVAIAFLFGSGFSPFLYFRF